MEWLGNSEDTCRSFLDDARQDAGWQLEFIQRGENPDDWKSMKTIGQGVRDLRKTIEPLSRIKCEADSRLKI